MFRSQGNALVSFHVTMSTWEAPSLLAPSHSKEALLGNLIFLATDAGVRSRCLDVFSVCAQRRPGMESEPEGGGEGVRAFSLLCLLSARICFLLQTWLAVARVLEAERVGGQSNNLDPFSGK